MKKSLLSLAVVGLFALSTSAFAFGDNVINGGIKDSYNNNSVNNSNNTDNSVKNTANGGAGGQGGQGGVGVGVGLGGSASATGGSATIQNGAVRNTNTNTNTQGQQQGQLQGQVQNAEGGDVRNSGNSESNSESTSKANANNNGNGSNNTEINVAASKTYRPPVSSAFAPTIFPTAPCMGSSSVGATGTLFSISGGTTWTSEECMILETARSFDQAGYGADGLAVRCQGKWAKNAPSCKALAAEAAPKAAAVAKPVAAAVVVAPAKAAVVAKPTAPQAETVVAPVVSPNGYYSVVTNPLGR